MKRCLVPLSAAAVVGALLPVSPTAAEEAAPRAFSGYTADATAAPVRIEIYEPTIPIPANPQLELVLGYSTVEADSGSSQGRASWLWPGDSVGEGLKTFVEQVGLPPQLGENGYPVQVNASQPSGTDEQRDEPFPGTVMRTEAGKHTTVAQVGLSPDAQVEDGEAPAAAEEGGTAGLPGLPLSGDLLTSFGQVITGGLPLAAPAPTEPAEESSEEPGEGDDDQPSTGSMPGLPPQLAVLVDVEGYTSSSRTVADAGSVTSIARSALGNVSLLGGLVVLEGVTSLSRSTSDGRTGASTEAVHLGGITVAGQTFALGPAGAEAAGQQQALPELPPELTAALAQLGLTLTLPRPAQTINGDKASDQVAGLRLEINAKTLRQQLAALPVGALVAAFPSDPPELKSALQALTGLAPKIVVTLGTASTKVDTVQGIAFPTGDDAPSDDAAEEKPGDSGGGGSPGTDGGGGGVPTGSAPAATGPVDAGAPAPAAADALPASELTGAGLPPLYSLPGALLVGGIALAAAGGTWLRKIGVIALGGAGSCMHGLDSGLPDLRKAPR
ncbi:hypothetical protein GON03_08995 [Nocardioides sp. MAH-18]|uniref:Uncharacterized protein n=1 Tax=Nocardioides agri TaxID=2682843 RepID=A0A6L6XQR8_9ACTN|nr:MULTISPECIES: choice-of-anchor P family protein [unclassified Nocardioides]MBA2954457.1 hypothetical protein [Nocardioides sp. CGMCC 1.13656]MVQ49318.1 hypothetical protein [Nocardioides sp. MAH-18]